MQRAGPLHPSVSLLLEFCLGIYFVRFSLDFRFLDLCSKVFSPGLHDDDDDDNARASIFIS
jgi:hypothetical protein